jgi:PadR family transcriptional regulator, regulatory protein PadR
MRMTVQTQLVLSRFLDEPLGTELYGLEIAKDVGLKGGTLYPILMRLEDAGYLTSGWESIDPHKEGRRPRRYYKITAAGATAARESIQETLAGLRGKRSPAWR